MDRINVISLPGWLAQFMDPRGGGWGVISITIANGLMALGGAFSWPLLVRFFERDAFIGFSLILANATLTSALGRLGLESVIQRQGFVADSAINSKESGVIGISSIATIIFTLGVAVILKALGLLYIIHRHDLIAILLLLFGSIGWTWWSLAEFMYISRKQYGRLIQRSSLYIILRLALISLCIYSGFNVILLGFVLPNILLGSLGLMHLGLTRHTFRKLEFTFLTDSSEILLSLMTLTSGFALMLPASYSLGLAAKFLPDIEVAIVQFGWLAVGVGGIVPIAFSKFLLPSLRSGHLHGTVVIIIISAACGFLGAIVSATAISVLALLGGLSMVNLLIPVGLMALSSVPAAVTHAAYSKFRATGRHTIYGAINLGQAGLFIIIIHVFSFSILNFSLAWFFATLAAAIVAVIALMPGVKPHE